MKQVVGYVHLDGQNGGQYADRFESEKTEEGTYKITFLDSFSSYPVVTLTPVSPYMTANAVLYEAYGDSIVVKTGFTDKPNTEYMDCSFFFTAVG